MAAVERESRPVARIRSMVIRSEIGTEINSSLREIGKSFSNIGTEMNSSLKKLHKCTTGIFITAIRTEMNSYFSEIGTELYSSFNKKGTAKNSSFTKIRT